jgi:ATP-dependent DNA ligase
MYLNGQSVMHLPIQERRQKLVEVWDLVPTLFEKVCYLSVCDRQTNCEIFEDINASMSVEEVIDECLERCK